MYRLCVPKFQIYLKFSWVSKINSFNFIKIITNLAILLSILNRPVFTEFCWDDILWSQT